MMNADVSGLHGKRRLLAAALLGLLTAGGGSAVADEGLTTRSGVVPMMEDGRLIGCQAPFEVVRADPEYSGGRRVRVTGLMAVIKPPGSAPGVMLRMAVGGPDDGADVDGVPPDLAALADGPANSLEERYRKDGQTQEGGDSGLFIYAMGPVTEAALRGAASDGRFSLVYALKPGGPLAPVTVDLTVKRRDFGGGGERAPGAPQAFTECLGRLRLDNLTR